MPSPVIHAKAEIQRPVSNMFILLSVLAALFLNGLPWGGIWLMLRPDFVAVVLLYWCMHKPWRVGIGLSWGVGISPTWLMPACLTARPGVYGARIWRRGAEPSLADV